ncbi:MAG TPA: cyclic nucleotide-binding domain-containing protein [Anaerolineales bacterium]|nr:cyclic nucleotide-binding domain-containing protein [Anaerolineales bacterium]
MQMTMFATGTGAGLQDNIYERSQSVKRVSIFRDMNQEYMSLLTPLFERYSCPSGATVIQQGQPADYLYLILDGKVQVNYKPYDGAPITITHVGKDGLFGWSAVVGSRTYTSSVTAIEDLETYRIQGSELRKLCMEHPEAGKEILEQLANAASSRWKNSHEQVKAILVNAMKN